MQRHRHWLPATLVLAGAMLPAIALADYSAPGYLASSEEVPTNASTGKAFGTGPGAAGMRILAGANGVQDTLIVSIAYNGLTGNATAAHIHGLAKPGFNAGVLIALSPVAGATGAGTINQTILISGTQRDQLKTGHTYFNIHTSANPGGEIRGQIDSLTAIGPKVPGTSGPLLALLTLILAGSGALFMMRRRSVA